MFYYDVHSLLDRFIRRNNYVEYLLYNDFYELKEIGSGGYGSVYTAKYRKYSEVKDMEETVVFKRIRNFDKMPELLISEVSSN